MQVKVGRAYKYARGCETVRALSFSLCLLASCGEHAPVEVEAVADRVLPVAHRQSGNLDESFLAVGTAVPTFAGAYFGDGGELVIRLTKLADSTRALAEMQQLLLDRVRVDPRSMSEAQKREAVLPRRWRMEEASYSFAELYQVRSELFVSAFQDDDVVSLDIDERHGKVVIGVTSMAAESRVQSARATSLAKALVVFRSVSAPSLTNSTTLYNRHRPITGGYQIGPSGCTTTIGARRGSEQLVLTNSHCSATPWSLDGGSIRQNNLEQGDSGSPIFAMFGGLPNTVAFYGIAFAEQGGASGVFSNFGQMKQDLGSNLQTF